MMKLVKDAYHSWGAEVVFITSNWAGNKEIMEGCKEVGIPAFVRLSILGIPVPCTSRTRRAYLLFSQGTLWDF